MSSNKNRYSELNSVLASQTLQTIRLDELQVESPQLVNREHPLFASIEQLGILQPLWIYQADTTYIIDGRNRLACGLEIDSVQSSPAYVLTDKNVSRSLAVILRLHLNSQIDTSVVNQTVIELCTDVSQADLENHVDLIEPLIAPQHLIGLDALCRLQPQIVSEWIHKKMPLKSVKRIRHLPDNLLLQLTSLLELSPSNGDWRRLLELIDEIYRRDKKAELIIEILRDGQSTDGLLSRLEAMRSPRQSKRGAAAKEGWQTLNPPKGSKLHWTAKKEGDNRLSLAFGSANELERSLEALKQRLTEDDFRAYIDRL
jgi:hypothetical protein